MTDGYKFLCLVIVAQCLLCWFAIIRPAFDSRSKLCFSFPLGLCMPTSSLILPGQLRIPAYCVHAVRNTY